MKRKNDNIIKIKKRKLYIAIFLFMVIIMCAIIRITPLISIYAVNLTTKIILNNKVNLLIIIVALFGMYWIERKKTIEKINLLSKEATNSGR